MNLSKFLISWISVRDKGHECALGVSRLQSPSRIRPSELSAPHLYPQHAALQPGRITWQLPARCAHQSSTGHVSGGKTVRTRGYQSVLCSEFVGLVSSAAPATPTYLTATVPFHLYLHRPSIGFNSLLSGPGLYYITLFLKSNSYFSSNSRMVNRSPVEGSLSLNKANYV